jgi:lysophospholipase L1-like esterase
MGIRLLRLLAAATWLLGATAPATGETAAPSPDPAAPAAEAVGRPLKVMPFGDSLTLGIGSTNAAGYRLAFIERMREEGVEVDMVGSQQSGPKGTDRDHEGYGGQGIAQIDRVSFNEIRRLRPDVVMVMIGTNDTKDFVAAAFRIRYSVLLDRALSESHVRMLVATIPPTRFDRHKRATNAVNAIVRSEVEKREAAGRPVRLVDIHALIDPRADFVDALHLNDAAYEKVGRAFADALLAMPAPAPRAALP